MKTAVFYYTQSGQALRVAQSLCRPMGEVVYKAIESEHVFPYPWSRRAFFDVFPETRLALPPFSIRPICFSDVADADLVIIVGQSWFLSPSLPLQAFFSDLSVKSFLSGRKVIFVDVCRNMWLMTMRKVKQYLSDCGAILTGFLIFQDPHPNLISAITVTRWLLHGKKESSMFLPAAGISEQDFLDASRLGSIIRDTWERDNMEDLQDNLLAGGAIKYQPSVLFLEKAGHRFFGNWAHFIRRKGGFGNGRRALRLSMFYYYLLFALFCVSPFVQLLFYLTYPLQHVERNKKEDCAIK